MIGWRSAKTRVAIGALALCSVSLPATLAHAHDGRSSRASEASDPHAAPYFPPFTHFVIIVREGMHSTTTWGDCAKTVQAGCNGKVQTKNHIRQVPELHKLAKTYALLDHYSTGTQPPSGPNHWWLFSAQSSSRLQQQSSFRPRDGVRPLPQRSHWHLYLRRGRRHLSMAEARERLLAQPEDQHR